MHYLDDYFMVGPSKFMPSNIDLSTTAHLPHHHVTMNCEAHSDIDRWLRFLLPWSRHAIIPDPHGTRAPNLELFTHASGSIGYGIFYAGHWTADP